MSIVLHDDLPFHEVPRIKTRILAGGQHPGRSEQAVCSVWEQWIEPDGFIPLHYHEVEEVLVFLAGEISLTLADEKIIVRAPATVTIPAKQIHGLRPANSTQVNLLAFFPTASPKIFAPDGSLRPLPWEDM